MKELVAVSDEYVAYESAHKLSAYKYTKQIMIEVQNRQGREQ